MGKINLKGVIIGGLVAGVVLNVVDYVLFGVVLRNDMAAAMQALNQPPMSDSVIPWYVFLDFLFGIFLVWVYAAVRPRYGAGPATAIKAGLIGWVATGLFHALFEWPVGMMPHNTLLLITLVALVQKPLATVAGAKFYTEM
jgi:hypothetical protein